MEGNSKLRGSRVVVTPRHAVKTAQVIEKLSALAKQIAMGASFAG